MSSNITTVRSFRLDKTTLRALRGLATELGCSPNRLAEALLREGLTPFVLRAVAQHGPEAAIPGRAAVSRPAE